MKSFSHVEPLALTGEHQSMGPRRPTEPLAPLFLDHRRSRIPMLVTAIRAPGNGRGTDIGFERRLVPGEARRIAANVAKLALMVATATSN